MYAPKSFKAHPRGSAAHGATLPCVADSVAQPCQTSAPMPRPVSRRPRLPGLAGDAWSLGLSLGRVPVAGCAAWRRLLGGRACASPSAPALLRTCSMVGGTVESRARLARALSSCSGVISPATHRRLASASTDPHEHAHEKKNNSGGAIFSHLSSSETPPLLRQRRPVLLLVWCVPRQI